MAQKPHTIDHLSFPSPLPTVSKSCQLNSGTKESSLNARQSPQQVSRSCVSQLGGQESKSSRRIKAMVDGRREMLLLAFYVLFQPCTPESEPTHQDPMSPFFCTWAHVSTIPPCCSEGLWWPLHLAPHLLTDQDKLWKSTVPLCYWARQVLGSRFFLSGLLLMA